MQFIVGIHRALENRDCSKAGFEHEISVIDCAIAVIPSGIDGFVIRQTLG